MDTSICLTSFLRRRSLQIAALCFAAVGSTTYLYISSSSASRYRRGLSIALPDGGCEVTRANLSENPIKPTWQASYPGSGARMTWSLIEGLTGILTNSDFDPHQLGYDRVVAVKTHYPVNNKQKFEQELDPLIDRALVILRNPKTAIPSLYNFEYERLHNMPTHTRRGPQDDWMDYRIGELEGAGGGGVKRQLEIFEEFVDYWMSKYPDRSKLHIVTYEELIDENTGPQTAESIANFLAQTDGVDSIDYNSIPCIWDTVVNYRDHLGEYDSRGIQQTLRKGPRIRPYSEEMLDNIAATLFRLLIKYGNDSELTRILNGYIMDVMKTPVEERLVKME
mmetsp:Transcript_39026/g.82063  ORF Transcript_39026/g.82063 Transcript_39026/m.82063 type:complete len:336 (-) Transcript_39026:199-1206(-)|eukprot:CAMPEP_0183739772 /NCGR_PEP_ID=MMETSP0737-20130205/57941_1 /TAXON_ID=385413 /ORGANISM="Thalassiosira miniscula, Strain CCMP1093" /LENGTH=335 /DNA_ID=CAMNT_0025974657 /DNA_START=100 /DNA_END=1107 /DNA_ORIENTATION=-